MREITPSIDEFQIKATQAFEKLPKHFKNLCEEVLFEVSEYPTEEVMATMELESPLDLLGLFEGTGFVQSGEEVWTGKLPNRIWLYRQPILEYAKEQDDTIDEIITHVLVHEIGHHFGLSDEDMEKIDFEPD